MSKQNNAVSEVMDNSQRIYWAKQVLKGDVEVVSFQSAVALAPLDSVRELVDTLNDTPEEPRDPERFAVEEKGDTIAVLDKQNADYSFWWSVTSSCVMAWWKIDRIGHWRKRAESLCNLLNGIEPETEAKPAPKFKPGQIVRLVKDVIGSLPVGSIGRLGEDSDIWDGSGPHWRMRSEGCSRGVLVHENEIELVPELNEPEAGL